MKSKEFFSDLKNLCLCGLAADAVLTVIFMILYLIMKSGDMEAALVSMERTLFIIGAVIMLVSAGAKITNHNEVSVEGSQKQRIFKRFGVFPITLGLSVFILTEGILIDLYLWR